MASGKTKDMRINTTCETVARLTIPRLFAHLSLPAVELLNLVTLAPAISKTINASHVVDNAISSIHRQNLGR